MIQDYLDGGGGPPQHPQPSEYSPEVTLKRIYSLESEYLSTKAALLLDLDDDDGSSSEKSAKSETRNGAMGQISGGGGGGGGNISGRTRDTFLNLHGGVVRGSSPTSGSFSGSPYKPSGSTIEPSGSSNKPSGSPVGSHCGSERIAIEIFPPTTQGTTLGECAHASLPQNIFFDKDQRTYFLKHFL